MSADARTELHGLIDQLPDDPATLAKIKDTVVKELSRRDAAIKALEERGLTVEEVHAGSGTAFIARQPEEADPVLRAFMDAPEDDEPLTEEDLAAIAEGKADVERGDVVRWEDYDLDRRARA